MKLTLADSKVFKDSVSIISDLVSEARFKIGKDSIDLVAMDPANVAMVVFKLLSTSFSEYEVTEEQKIALNLNNLKQILKRAGANDIMTMELSDNKFKITLKSNTTRTFFLPIIEFEDRDQKVPELNFAVSITTNTNILNEAIEDVAVVAESVSFGAQKDKFFIAAEGDLSQVKIEIPSDSDTNVKTDTMDLVKSKYSIEYLKKMIQGSKLSPQVTINFSKDYPLRLNYQVVNKLLMSFILAPRVDND
ncbi:MAG: proliferating cell nuclear antigen (pcna) [archaeon]